MATAHRGHSLATLTVCFGLSLHAGNSFAEEALGLGVSDAVIALKTARETFRYGKFVYVTAGPDILEADARIDGPKRYERTLIATRENRFYFQEDFYSSGRFALRRKWAFDGNEFLTYYHDKRDVESMEGIVAGSFSSHDIVIGRVPEFWSMRHRRPFDELIAADESATVGRSVVDGVQRWPRSILLLTITCLFVDG